MLTKIILTFTMLSYAMIVSQAFMYILSLKKVQLNLEAEEYRKIRKLTDHSMRTSFRYVIYAALLLNILLVIVTLQNLSGLLFTGAVLALLCLVAEILLTVKKSLPVNDRINEWTSVSIPSDWETTRDKWFTIFQYRQVASITGFCSLLIASVFN